METVPSKAATEAAVKRGGLAAIFLDDVQLFDRSEFVRVVVEAANNTVFLVFLWVMSVTSRQAIAGDNVEVGKHLAKVGMFATAYFLLNVLVALWWPQFTENLLQAGMFHIATVMFSCLPETR